VLWAACFPAIHLVVLLEERELRDRFGAAFDARTAARPAVRPALHARVNARPPG
jgi:hypothetical protein